MVSFVQVGDCQNALTFEVSVPLWSSTLIKAHHAAPLLFLRVSQLPDTTGWVKEPLADMDHGPLILRLEGLSSRLGLS